MKIPDGNPTALLIAFAEHGGSISQTDAYAALRGRYPNPTKTKLATAIKYGLASARRVIREAIGDAADCNLEQVPNPIPNVTSGWRSEIQIGYAVVNDDNRVEFRTREELDRF